MEFTTKAFSPWHALVKVYEDNCQMAEAGGDTDYRVTVERIEPEQPQWWQWDGHDEEWHRHHPRSGASLAGIDPRGGDSYEFARVLVYGTTADRDAKRDALLEAARKAGTPD